MAVHVPGLVSIIIFYLIILGVGIFAARRTGLKLTNLRVNDIMLANRSITPLLGFFTMTATWVGGGYINGSAEAVATDGLGLVWCQAPVGYSLGLLLGGLFFADKMRSSGFTTMLDPFHWKYGDIMTVLLYLPALTGDVFWSASILSALGATLKVILDINLETAIIVSAAIALCYTLLGGLYSVAYTDVLQLICIFVGLWICVPYAMTNDATDPIYTNYTDVWIGSVEPAYIGNYIDFGLLLILGGIPWQVYWQRVLSARSVASAQFLSLAGSAGCIVSAIPAVVLGAVAAQTDWNQTGYGYPTIQDDDVSLTLPLVMRYLCPAVVTFIGLGAVSAAVMSSTDSAILSSSCMFSRNVFTVIYARIHKKKPSETLQVWIVRLAQVVVAVLACVVAITVNSVYYLFVLCGDLIFVIVFPQLLCVMYIKTTNSYGSMAAFILGLFFRLMGGEDSMGLPAAIKYPWYDEVDKVQLFPFRTMAMLISLFAHIGVSFLTHFLFTRGILPASLDIYRCFQFPQNADHMKGTTMTPYINQELSVGDKTEPSWKSNNSNISNSGDKNSLRSRGKNADGEQGEHIAARSMLDRSMINTKL